MQRNRGNWLTWVVAVAALLGATGEARAFYWYGWPGNRVPPDRTIVTPGQPGNPPDRTWITPPPVGPQVVVPPNEPVPEPGTAIVTLIGLGTLAVLRRLRASRASHGTGR